MTLTSQRIGSSTQEHYCLFETAIGVCGIAWSERGITRLQLPEAERSATERRLRKGAERSVAERVPAWVGEVMADIRDYLAGRQVDFTGAPLDLTPVSSFHGRIYDETRRIVWGKTATYGDLAARVGAPGAARAVGQAMGRNPIPIIIPCHRVLASGGRVGGFSAYGGASTKTRLLALEGVRLGEESAPLLPGL